MSFFKKREVSTWTPPDKKVKYPKWSFVKTEDSFFLLLDDTKLEFISERAFNSWCRPWVQTSNKAISGYSLWKKIGFAPGTILRSIVDGSLYFLSGKDPLNAERRLIATPDFWVELGFDHRQSIVVSSKEIDFHIKGEDILGV